VIAAASPGGWSFNFVGLPAWLVVPLAALAVWALLRIGRRDRSGLPARARRGLAALRAAAAGAIVVFLLEPTCSRRSSESEKPTVAVLLDRSGSMAVKDTSASEHTRLNEAVALGLVRADLRDVSAMKAALALSALLRDLPGIESDLQGREGPSRRAASVALSHAAALRALEPHLAGFASVHAGVSEVAGRLERAYGPGADAPAESLQGLRRRCEDLARLCREAQVSADAALVAAAERSSPIERGLAELARMTRFQRARRFVERTVIGALSGRASVKVFALERSLAPLGPDASGKIPETPVGGPTDLEGALSALASSTGEGLLGGVLIVSDGRVTAGGDPVPAARALAARGAPIAAVMVGDPQTPRDAVVAEILGSTEVFLGETVRLDVRFRITGFSAEKWDLILARDGKELARRTVQGTGDWQLERFEFPADAPGRMHVQARLERRITPPPQPAGGRAAGSVDFGELDAPDLDVAAGPAPGGGPGAPSKTETGILREYWSGIDGYEVSDLTRSPRFAERPDGQEILNSFEGPVDWGETYGSRLRGFLVPPQSGSYTFWISADDKAELWLSTDASPANKTLIARVPEWTSSRQWDKYPSQKSAHVELRAGLRYYVEVLHKESRGGDNVAVGWQMPDSGIERPIPGHRLIPYREGAESRTGEQLPAEEASLDNNHADIAVAVSQDPLRVLAVDASPRWDLRYLVSLFERDRRTEVVRRYRSVRLPRGEVELLPRTQEEMDGYDCLVLGDLRPEELGPEDQQRVVNFVAGRGGFLVLVAGPRGMPSGYSLGGLADVMPVRNVPALGAPRASVVLGPAGADSPITAVLDDSALNKRLWPSLPQLGWVARAVAAKVAGEVLLQTDDAARTPVVVTSRFGAGRVLYVGTDESWRWRDKLGDRVHQTFWLQALRWGLGERLRGKDPRLTVSLDRSIMTPAERAELRARARLADGTTPDSPPRVKIERVSEKGEAVPGSARELEMIRVADSPGIWRQSIEGLEEGVWKLSVRSDHPELGELVETRELAVRKRPGLEGLELSADAAALERIVGAGGGGRWGGLEDGEEIVRELASGLEGRKTYRVETWSLWDNYWALLAVLTLLCVEWVWRKRLGLP